MPILLSSQICSIRQAQPGMKLAKAVLTENGAVLLNAEMTLTRPLILKLAGRGISKISIQQEAVNEVAEDRLASERQEFIYKREQIIDAVADIFNDLSHLKELSVDKLDHLAEHLLLPLVARSNTVFSYLHIINSKGDYLFRHSVNVAIFAGIIGIWLKLPQDKIKDLLIAGILHDIGKICIPFPILDKPGKLSSYEMDIMKLHAQLGYDMIRETQDLSAMIKQGILEHHERLDGSGYPLQLPAEKISEIGRIIAVADVYDAMISRRVYREAISPLVVMKELYQSMFGALDAVICLTFIEQAKKCLIGSLVKLSNGLLGKIVYINERYFVGPIVQMATGECVLLEEGGLKISEFII